jgi:hypothetical protein
MTFIIGLSLATMAGAAGYSRGLSAESGWPLHVALKQAAQVEEISGYRTWIHINPKPWRVSAPTDMG